MRECWWGGSEKPAEKGGTEQIGEWTHVRADYPHAENGHNRKAVSQCVLYPKDSVKVSGDPIPSKRGDWWVPLYAGDVAK